MQKHEKYPLWLGYMDMPTFERKPVTMVSGNGMTLTDSSGENYFDFVSGIRNVLLGYSETKIIDAIYQQLQTLPFSRGSSFGNNPALELSEKLIKISPVNNARVLFHNSGSEAVEAAIKLVRQKSFFEKSKKNKIITLKKGYHGQTITALSASGEFYSKEPFFPWTDGFVPVDFPNDLKDIEQVEVLLQNVSEIGAIMIEPLLGNAGVLELPKGYIIALRNLCKKYDLLLICDEISTAFGRLGEWFVSKDAEPDILLVGKAITNGYLPLSATIVSENVWKKFDENGVFRHGQTNINHPVCCRAGLATIDILEEINAPMLCMKKGNMLKDALSPLFQSGKVQRIRGKGLMYAIVFDQTIHDKHESMKWLQTEMMEQGFIIGQIDNTILLAPPIIIENIHIGKFIETLESLLV